MFLNFCYWLGRFRLSWLAAFLRVVLHRVLWPFVREKQYGQNAAGYIGWIDAPLFGVLAFRRDDQRLQYRW